MSEIKVGKVRTVQDMAKEIADKLIRRQEDDFMRTFCGVDPGAGPDKTVTFTARRNFEKCEVVYYHDVNEPDVIDVEFRDVTLPALPAKPKP